jgi:hypothetical protein
MRAMAVTAFLLAASVAHGQALPKADIRDYCAKRQVTPGFSPDDFLALCVDDESASYVVLRENWKAYSAESRKMCLQAAGRALAYSDLQACLLASESKGATSGWRSPF